MINVGGFQSPAGCIQAKAGHSTGQQVLAVCLAAGGACGPGTMETMAQDFRDMAPVMDKSPQPALTKKYQC